MRIKIGDILKTGSGLKVVTAMANANRINYYEEHEGELPIDYRMSDWKEGQRVDHESLVRNSIGYLNIWTREKDEIVGSIFNPIWQDLYIGCTEECPLVGVGCRVCERFYPRVYNGPEISDKILSPGTTWMVNSILLDGFGRIMVSSDSILDKRNFNYGTSSYITIDSWTVKSGKRELREKVCELCVLGSCDDCLINKRIKNYGKR